MKPLEVIGLDVGTARTGLARGNTAAKLAEPLQTVPTNDVLPRLKHQVASGEVGMLVVGLPRNLSGDDTAQTTWTRDWVKKLKNNLQIPIYWQDEALTTESVKIRKSKAKNVPDEHALAAATILQDFFDRPKELWVEVQ